MPPIFLQIIQHNHVKIFDEKCSKSCTGNFEVKKLQQIVKQIEISAVSKGIAVFGKSSNNIKLFAMHFSLCQTLMKFQQEYRLVMTLYSQLIDIILKNLLKSIFTLTDAT
jgi:hypothetical protein